jgi:phosphatidylglycerophosphate synthase
MLVLTVSYILRDQWVMALRALAAGDGADMKANWVGKTRTALSFPIGCLLYCYIAFGWCGAMRPLMMGVEGFAIALNLYSFIAYTRRYAAALH